VAIDGAATAEPKPGAAIDTESNRATNRSLMSVVEFVEHPDGAWMKRLQMCPKLSASRSGSPDLCAPESRPAAPHSRRCSRGQRTQPGGVGAQCVGQHERIESIVLTARRAGSAASGTNISRSHNLSRVSGPQQGWDRHLLEDDPA
jgi:hypothetical protein